MATQIQIVAHEGIDESFLTQIRTYANELWEKADLLSPPPNLSITIWRTVEDLQAFYGKEKEALSVVTGEETDFLATHEAWRGYPRIHVCQEKLRGLSAFIVQGVIHHEIGHSIHHGSQEFYTFRFSSTLQEAGRSCSLDLPLLQQCVYLLSVAVKDREVVQWLAKIGFGFGQQALLEYLISDTEEERRVWEVVQSSSPLRRIAFAAFLKTLLPIEAMISVGVEEAQTLRDKWNEAYAWLSEREREGLFWLAQSIISHREETFQDRLEQATLHLITDQNF